MLTQWPLQMQHLFRGFRFMAVPAQVTQARTSRHQAWLGRKRGADPQEWVPRKRYRKDTYLWLCQTDHQLSFISGGVGLAAFAAGAREGKPWHQWPLLSYAGDQGSKEFSAVQCMKYKLKLNLDEVPDAGHGVWNDCKKALRESGHWSHTCLMMLSWNVRHGPWAEDVRMQEVVGCFKNFFKVTKDPRHYTYYCHSSCACIYVVCL